MYVLLMSLTVNNSRATILVDHVGEFVLLEILSITFRITLPSGGEISLWSKPSILRSPQTDHARGSHVTSQCY